MRKIGAQTDLFRRVSALLETVGMVSDLNGWDQNVPVCEEILKTATPHTLMRILQVTFLIGARSVIGLNLRRLQEQKAAAADTIIGYTTEIMRDETETQTP